MPRSLGSPNKRHVLMSEEHRAKIKSVAILNALQEHIFDKRKMSASQVTAAMVLLRKTLPDLAASDINVNGKIIVELNDHWAKT
jgi:two-component SAPR family response regulator